MIPERTDSENPQVGRLGEAKRSFDRVLQISPRFASDWFWASRGTLHYMVGEIDQAVALFERARMMGSFIAADRIILSHYYESAGRHEDAQAIVQEMLSAAEARFGALVASAPAEDTGLLTRIAPMRAPASQASVCVSGFSRIDAEGPVLGQHPRSEARVGDKRPSHPRELSR